MERITSKPVHEESYRGRGLRSAFHRRRLREYERALRALELAGAGRLADFGCSNGFVLKTLQETVFLRRDWSFAGFDHAGELLDLARDRGLAKTEFHFVELNTPQRQIRPEFDVVTCFETLEHTGDFRNAVRNLSRAVKPGGYLVISVPNEVGMPGLAKFLVRGLVKREAYGDFFEGKSRLDYGWRLLTRRRIDGYRDDPNRKGWGPHLGFDRRVFESFLRSALLKSGEFNLIKRRFTVGGFAVFYAFRKAVSPGSLPGPE